MDAKRGIDVSYAQGLIDWKRVAASGVDFAMLRMGKAETMDTFFEKNWAGAKAAGIPVGAYWFSYAVSAKEARQEAEAAKKIMNTHPLELGLFYDFEYDTETKAKARGVVFSKKSRGEVIRAFCDAIPGTGVYLNGDYLRSRLESGAVKGYPLWIASWKLPYATGFEKNPASAPSEWGLPTIWQFSCKGRIDGIRTDVDLNFGYWKNFPKKKETPPAQEKKSDAEELKKGDAVCVSEFAKSGLRKKAKTYDGRMWTVYLDRYEVMQVNGDRVVIGSKGVVTAAVNRKILKKIR